MHLGRRAYPSMYLGRDIWTGVWMVWMGVCTGEGCTVLHSPVTATEVGGTHPTGMHSSLVFIRDFTLRMDKLT